jgi:uncharacterized protein YkwD
VAVIALLASLLAAVPSDREVIQQVQARFERSGRAIPPAEASLSAAAREVAAQALEVGAEAASGPLAVTAAISRRGGWDPSPLVVVLRGEPAALAAALEAHALAEEPVSLLGAGVAERGELAAVAVLLVRRRVDLEPFPRALAAPSSRPQVLCGQLRAPLTSAQVFVTRPGGEVVQQEMQAVRGARCATLTFPERGRHVVEVLAAGPRGPEVGALFFVEVGATAAGQQEAAAQEPATDAEARPELLARINALRRSQGAGPLAADPVLEGVAQAWAERLAKEGFFAHVGPEGSDLRKRLAAVSYRFTAAGENLGLARGPLGAHFGIEHSPGHRKNLLEPEHVALGIGLARRPDGLLVLVEVLARPAAAPPGPALANPQEAAYQALAAQRARLRLPTLAVSPVLEALAQEHARAAVELGAPRAQLPGRPRLQDRVFETLDEAGTVSVDVFVADSPRAITDSKSLRAPRNALVGVGLAQEEVAPRGRGRYWIVVIYAGPR